MNILKNIESVKRHLCKDLGFEPGLRLYWNGRRFREFIKPISSGSLSGLLILEVYPAKYGGDWSVGLYGTLLPHRRHLWTLFQSDLSDEEIDKDYLRIFVTPKSEFYNPTITNEMRYQKYVKGLQNILDETNVDILLAELQSRYDVHQKQKQELIDKVLAEFPSFHNIIDEDDIGEYLTFYESPQKGKKVARMIEFSVGNLSITVGKIRFNNGTPVFRDFYGKHYSYGKTEHIDTGSWIESADGTREYKTRNLDQQIAEIAKLVTS